jgi:hypothetical protein
MIGLVSCSQQKLSRPARAHLLYCSQLFKLSLRYAEAHCEKVLVLSARHGLVELDTILKPYDQRLGGKKEKEAWARRVAGALVFRYGRDADLMMLAGADYTRPLTSALRTHDGHDGTAWRGWRGRIEEPLKGKMIGQRLSFLRLEPHEAHHRGQPQAVPHR